MNYYLLLFFILTSCSRSYEAEATLNDVHDQLSVDVEITLTEKGNIKALIKSKLLERNDNSLELKLTDNVNVDLYDDNYQHSSLITSNYAFVSETENKINAFGDVIVAADNGQQLWTDSLLWDNKADKIFTNASLTFISGNLDTLYGTGFESNIDLTNWKITKPRGSINDE
ncbi:LPS export ABC transporter periplasmic protein LptC [Candidatus Marinimicrobia bacterium]|jgi:LPS export ABC transporter protein LptC|nr:LPS export ABC transporter periplasmic protein LptC [Candidatus Neomarinimicrobiota bacterium]MDC0521303.1 LPS export ABC transporter periplasmic protein LptC [Candidatus Neomarinimicrobiota bacterium]MDC0878817.1 LPS export ABC transporter periplasmic protein LptC [Candidatus Neomarinimicrobiota bacterium]MDC1145808.1 LPS export ABC transporter periplasmic protein LptC [Candidatus Neomarinimicrobiota bacterium]|tara:strand:- start:643 stop:1155 length:513 start_codon:yes stop_codon:yes gene_type:complete